MEKITKEQFDIVKSNITKKNTVEKYVNLTKLVLDTAVMQGDYTFNVVVDTFNDMLNGVVEIVFGDIEKKDSDYPECPSDGSC